MDLFMNTGTNLQMVCIGSFGNCFMDICFCQQYEKSFTAVLLS